MADVRKVCGMQDVALRVCRRLRSCSVDCDCDCVSPAAGEAEEAEEECGRCGSGVVVLLV